MTTLDRQAVISAVAAELDERAGRCLEAHGDVGAGVADRLGLVQRITPELAVPRGVGVYLRGLHGDHDSPETVARLCADHGVSWAALMAIGLMRRDGRLVDAHQDVERTAEYAEALRAAGVDVWVWLFPTARDPEGSAEHALEHVRACRARGGILDVEAPYKGRPEACARLARAMRAGLEPGQGLASTTYAVRRFHSDLPFEVLATETDQGQLQAYEDVTPELAREAVEDYRAIGFRSVAAVGPAFGRRSGLELGEYLDACYLDAGAPIIDALGIWSWPQLDRREWPVLERWARRFG